MFFENDSLGSGERKGIIVDNLGFARRRSTLILFFFVVYFTLPFSCLFFWFVMTVTVEYIIKVEIFRVYFFFSSCRKKTLGVIAELYVGPYTMIKLKK